MVHETPKDVSLLEVFVKRVGDDKRQRRYWISLNDSLSLSLRLVAGKINNGQRSNSNSVFGEMILGLHPKQNTWTRKRLVLDLGCVLNILC